MKPSPSVVDRWAGDSLTQSLSPGQNNMVNKMQLHIGTAHQYLYLGRPLIPFPLENLMIRKLLRLASCRLNCLADWRWSFWLEHVTMRSSN